MPRLQVCFMWPSEILEMAFILLLFIHLFFSGIKGMKSTWPANIIGRLEITWTSPRASACWYQTSMAFEQDSGPPGTCAHPFSQLNVGPQMSKPPCLGPNFINDWSDKFDSIKKGYVKQINDILMNFSTQFEKPCYVKHGFQLPSRRNLGQLSPLWRAEWSLRGATSWKALTS